MKLPIVLGLLLSFAFAFPGRGAEALNLEQAIALALREHPDARAAGHRIRAARASLQEANAAFWPGLQIQSSYTRGNNPMQVFGWALNQRAFSPELDFNNVPRADNLNARGVLTVPLYQGGRALSGRRSAEARFRMAEFEAEAIRNDLAFEVAYGWHSLLKAREFIRAAEGAARAFETNLGVAVSREEAGTLLRSEVLEVEVRLAQAREDLVRARNSALLAERALHYLLGHPGTVFHFIDEAPELNEPDEAAMARRSELEAARFQVLAAGEEINRARAGRLPRLNAFGAYDHDRGWELRGDGSSWTAGVVFQWDIWDGHSSRSRVRRAAAERDVALDLERKARLQAGFEAEQSRLSVMDAKERLAVTGKMVGQAETSAELTRLRFEQGLALPSQLFDAEQALTAARVRRAQSQSDLRIAVAGLRRALGLAQIPNSMEEQE
jgi:outer membrane protein